MFDSSKIFVVDGKIVLIGIGILVILVKRLVDEGKSVKEIVERIIKKIDIIRYFFVVEILEYFKKGGRILFVKVIIGNILNIKLIFYFVDGVVEFFDKVRGMKRVLLWIIEEVKKKGFDFKNQFCGFLYVGFFDEVSEYVNMVK